MDKHSTIKCKNNFGQEVELPSDKFFFRPSAYGFIVDDDKIAVLDTKSDGKIWFPGGGVEIHERLEEAVARETKEETGLDVEVIKLVFAKENFFYYQPSDLAFHAFLFFFLCKPLNKKMISDDRIDDPEVEKPRWVPLAELKEENITDLGKDICLHLQNLIKETSLKN